MMYEGGSHYEVPLTQTQVNEMKARPEYFPQFATICMEYRQFRTSAYSLKR